MTPTIVVRPRGWRLCEKHISIDGRPLPAALVDFGLFFFHNAQQLIDNGAGPYFYLPKLESHLEARLWNDVFVQAQALLGIPQGTIRATVLIETLPAAFEMEEILYELRDHSSGLNAGRWDYIFSYIKTFAQRGDEYVLPDRSQITMTTPFMRSYTELLVSTCHRRGAHAIGGMAAFVPNKADPAVTEQALAKVQGGQGAGGRRRLRRLLGGAPGAGADLHRGLHRGARRPAEPARQAASGRARHGRRPDRGRLHPGHRHPGRACGPTSRWRCST